MKYFCQTKLIKINMCWRIVSMSNILERNKRKPVLAMNTKNAVNKRKFSNIHIVYLHSLSITYIFSCSYLIIWIEKQNKSQEKLNTKKSIFCEYKKIYAFVIKFFAYFHDIILLGDMYFSAKYNACSSLFNFDNEDAHMPQFTQIEILISHCTY